MANRYSITSGLASASSTWDGGLGVPVSGDRVLIRAGHTVTVDGAYTWGDDSTGTVVINTVSTTASIYVQGTLKASRTASSTLTCRGDLLVGNVGSLDYGTELDPIPAAVIATIVANYSTAMAHNKYSVMTDASMNWTSFRMWGANKNPRSTISAASATDTTFTVADATLWAVGDIVVFGMSVAENTIASVRYRAITAIDGDQVTVGANLGAASQSGRSIMNLTRNVRVIGHQGNLYRSSVSVRVPNALSALGAIEIGCCEFGLTGGSASADRFGGLTFNWMSAVSTNANVKRIYRPVCHDIHSVVGSAVTSVSTGGTWAPLCCFNNQAYTYTIEEPVITSQMQGNAILLYGGTSTCFSDIHIIRAARVSGTGYSQGSVGCTFTGGYVEALVSDVTNGSGISIEFVGVTFNGLGRLSSNFTAYGSVRFINCDLGGAFGFYISSMLYAATGGFTPALFENCIVHPSFVVTRVGWLNTLKPASYFNFRNKNNDTTGQEIYRRGGKVLRDNTVVSRGLSSLSMSPWYADEVLTHEASAPVMANSTVRIKGLVRFNAAYGATTPPTLTISGMSIAPVLFTAPAVADTWHAIDITITNPQSYHGSFVLSFRAKSAANTETATAWFDGIAIPDFVTWTRFYGDLYDPSSSVSTVNPVTQLTEVQAAALTGISFASGTLTITEPHTIREVYDWMQWYECSNRLDPILTSSNGLSFTLAADLVLSADLTSAGTLAMPANALMNTGSSTLAITHNAGTLVSIAVTGYALGSRVQIYDVTSSTELYNAEPAGTSISLNANYSAPHTLRLRVGYAVGVDAMLPIEATALLSAAGASFLVTQVPDEVYNTLAINGGTCTEFAPDFPNLQIDLSDGDGTTSVQRLYAWAAWSQTSAQGIALMFRGVQARDAANYVIDASVVNARLDNVTGTPVIIAGGYLSRTDGTTVIAATSGSIQMDPGKAFIAPTAQSAIAAEVVSQLQATAIPANMVQIKGQAINGTGTESNPWGP